MFANQYYCLVASLREYTLDSDTKGFDAREIVGEILEGVKRNDAREVRLLYGYYDCENLAALRGAFGQRFYSLELRDGTRVAEDVWARAEEDSLRGLFLRELRRRRDAAGSGEERRQAELAARFGLAALDGRDL